MTGCGQPISGCVGAGGSGENLMLFAALSYSTWESGCAYSIINALGPLTRPIHLLETWCLQNRQAYRLTTPSLLYLSIGITLYY